VKFSFVLATVGRVHELERFLESLKHQNHAEIELIVVDQSTDRLAEPLLSTYQSSFQITYLTAPLGLSRARNEGLKYVNGEVVAFPDDDCEYPRAVLSQIEEILVLQPETQVVLGRWEDRFGKNYALRFDSKEGFVDKWSVGRRVSSTAMFFRREVIEQVGSFDEELGVGAYWGSSEDVDYVLRSIEEGFRVFYHPKLVIWHPNSNQEECGASALEKLHKYAMGTGRVIRKHDYPIWFIVYVVMRSLLAAAYWGFRGQKCFGQRKVVAARGYMKGWLGN
jgi:GT2 family glycosyltransferase